MTYDLVTSLLMVLNPNVRRYSGGMVPDVHHILVKEGGVFCNPCSASSPAKLRVLYEVFPLSFIVAAAGGAAILSSTISTLDMVCETHDQRSIVCMGSKAEVEKTKAAMDNGL